MDSDCKVSDGSAPFTAPINLALNFYALENVTFKTEQKPQA